MAIQLFRCRAYRNEDDRARRTRHVALITLIAFAGMVCPVGLPYAFTRQTDPTDQSTRIG